MFEIGDMVKVIGENYSEEIGKHEIDEGKIGKVVNVFVDEEFEDEIRITNFEVVFDEEAEALTLAED
ncbi:hypothetical protein ACIQHV_11155 [Bacillus bombysepticus]|uniref:Uncharacterized protein n=1 Tax=Bacillus thuringiensis serovar kumamotoensis TaxID=132267 RepID=A0A9X6PS47_BACUK|nr:hypothetical protein [Bacillus thuringiensis]MEC2869952.1 hypothetical protein [Bacillus cereus]OTZ76198.1 hypothetical protein BK769_07220 [Bacillus thuringiensis serovar kumamtoensis]